MFGLHIVQRPLCVAPQRRWRVSKCVVNSFNLWHDGLIDVGGREVDQPALQRKFNPLPRLKRGEINTCEFVKNMPPSDGKKIVGLHRRFGRVPDERIHYRTVPAK